MFKVHVAENAEPTAPFFTRPSIEQPYYDISVPRGASAPSRPGRSPPGLSSPLTACPFASARWCKPSQRVTGPGGIYEPLVVTPAIGVRVDPKLAFFPLDGSALPVRVTVHTQAAAEGTVALKLPEGWQADPAEAQFHRTSAGTPIRFMFSVTPAAVKAGAYSIQAVAHSGGHPTIPAGTA